MQRRGKILEKDARQLAAIAPHILSETPLSYLQVCGEELEKLHRRAKEREAEVVAIAALYPEYQTYLPVHRAHRKRVSELLYLELPWQYDGAVERESAEKLNCFLDEPAWRKTKKGYRATSPFADELQVYQKKPGGAWWAMIHIFREEPQWFCEYFPPSAVASAQRFAVRNARKRLMMAHRLPQVAA